MTKNCWLKLLRSVLEHVNKKDLLKDTDIDNKVINKLINKIDEHLEK